MFATNLTTSRAPIYQLRWGQFGTGPGLLDIPIDLAAAPDGAIFVADLGQCSIQKFDGDGQFLSAWERCGLSPGLFYDLDAIAVAPNGSVFAADSKLFQSDVHRFDAAGNHELTWQLGYSFILPGSIAVDADGNIYVTEVSHNRVRKFDAGGNDLLEWGTSGTADGRFWGPIGVAVDSAGNVYVVDAGNERVQVFTGNGVHLATWRDVFADVPFSPALSDIAVDSSGYVYVSDSANNLLYKLTGDGTLIVTWGTQGQAAGEFDGPTSLVVDHEDHLYVLDSNNFAVQKYRNSLQLVDHATPDDGDDYGPRALYTALTPGEYRVTARLPYGWTDDGFACGDAQTLPIPDGRAVELQAGGVVSCTLQIVGPGELTFVNTVEDGNARPTAWSYAIVTDTQISDLPGAVSHATPTLLPRGRFTATVDGPNGYAIASASASGACALVNGQVVVDVMANQAATCTVSYRTISEVHVTETFGATLAEEGQDSIADGAACFWLTTTTRPDAAITLAVLPRTSQVRADKTLLPITTSNWNNTSMADTSNFVCVRADDDDIADDTGSICKSTTDDLLGTTPGPEEECGDHLGVIDLQIFESYDPAYTGATPFASNTTLDLDSDPKTVDVLLGNDDRAGVRFTPAYGVLHVDESGTPVETHCYWVSLTSRPVAPVTVTAETGDDQITLSPTSIDFEEWAWDILDQRITWNQICVQAQDDAQVEAGGRYCTPRNTSILADDVIEGEVCGDHISAINHTVASADPRYDGLTAFESAAPDVDGNGNTLDVLIRDDDRADVLMTPGTLNLVEGNSGSYDVVLASRPAAPVLVVQEAARLEFTRDNWNLPQSLEYLAPDNAIADGGRQVSVSHAVMSADSNFHGLIPLPVVVYIADDDSAGIVLETPGQSGRVQVTEGGPGAQYRVRLTAEPTAPITLTLTTGTQMAATPDHLLFDSTNWNGWQSVTVEATDDPDIEADVHTARLFHHISSDDPAYQGQLGPVLSVSIQDNDAAGLSVKALSALTVTEDGATSAQMSVVPTSRPTATVTVQLDGAPFLTATPPVLSFAPDTWSAPQVVTLRALDDAVDWGSDTAQKVKLTMQSEDSHYDELSAPAITVVVLDNDEAAVEISPQQLALATGDAATYAVRLASQPIAPVLVIVNGSDPAQALILAEPCTGVSGQNDTCLVFTEKNWETAQVLTVRGVAAGQATIRHTAESLDPQYSGLPVATVNVEIVATPVVDERAVFLPLIPR